MFISFVLLLIISIRVWNNNSYKKTDTNKGKQKFSFKVVETFFLQFESNIDATKVECHGKYANDSKHGNAKMVLVETDSEPKLGLEAMKDIKAGKKFGMIMAFKNYSGEPR